MMMVFLIMDKLEARLAVVVRRSDPGDRRRRQFGRTDPWQPDLPTAESNNHDRVLRLASQRMTTHGAVCFRSACGFQVPCTSFTVCARTSRPRSLTLRRGTYHSFGRWCLS
jgi:hypothetical protein